jgi:hypothetical protein
MALDIKEGYGKVKKKVEATEKYKEVNKDIQDLKKKKGETLEIYKKDAKEQLSNAKKKVDKFQKKIEKKKSQFDELFDLTKILSGDNKKNGQDSKTAKYLKKVFITALQKLEPKIKEILNELGTQAIGCSEDQQYAPNQSIYIKVSSIDFLGLLKEDPTSVVGKISYEKQSISYGAFPFAMNKELYSRIQNINQPYSVPAANDYLGKSTQALFDVSYVESYFDPVNNQTITGNFFKFDMKPRQNTLVTEFLKDYYDTIKPIDLKNIFAQLMNILTGAISIEKGDGDGFLEDFNKILLIIKRILGLCFDSNTEIDVTGNAKVSENDNIDESFFEFDEIDLKFIEQRISDVKLGVAEFEECDTVKVPVDSLAIIDAVNNLNFFEDTNNNNTINDASNLTDVVTNGFFPLKVNIDTSFLKEFPKAVVMAVLSPKVVLPLMLLAKSIGKTFVDEITSYLTFAKKLKTYFAEFVSKVTEVFIKILFDIIKKDLKLLIESIIKDIFKEKKNKNTAIILSLTALIFQIANIIKDFRECKSIINQLQSLLANIQTTANQLPLPLLLASKLRKGTSKTSAFVRVIENFQELGLPTGQMPDGSPNLMLASIKAVIDGMDDEITENARADIGIPALSVLPTNLTVPNSASGVIV